MTTSHILGFPRIGAQRELKRTVEAYWKNELDWHQLQIIGQKIRAQNWATQSNAGLSFVTVGDFSWYDQVLDMSALLGVIPERFGHIDLAVDIDTYFRMARGRAPTGKDVATCDMTKWFDTNYHYIVPEFSWDQEFHISSAKLFNEIHEAEKLGHNVKPVIIGPLTYLWLGKLNGDDASDKLTLLPGLIKAYQKILERIAQHHISWIQIDEPILVLDLPKDWQSAFQHTYQRLQTQNLNILLATYFGDLQNNMTLACELPVAGLHIDAVRAPEQLKSILQYIPKDKILSLGVIDGRNIWRNDLRQTLALLKPYHEQLGERLWIGSSCSLLHSPVDLANEKKLDAEFKDWLAFAVQKVEEVTALAKGLSEGESAIQQQLLAADAAMRSKQQSKRIHKTSVKQRCTQINAAMLQRHASYPIRQQAQHKALNLPLFPTTTIGSFPQTNDIRKLRQEFKSGTLSEKDYHVALQEHMAKCIQEQERLGLDVLVHGEFERNDMVEHFSELLEGFAHTQNGWVQSYGSRCVKPPIIYGDIERPSAMTVDWIKHAQTLTKKPMKGMLTGPTTMLSWSFVRNDQSRFETAKQMALALRDEIYDLENASITVIQVDEPAFRESLPLRRKDWPEHLKESIECFKLTTAGVNDATQIHTHMCYSEFNDIIESIAALDADVVTIEASRSDMELLKAFQTFAYPNEIGPGVYDVHSPQVPTEQQMVHLLELAAECIPAERLWVNPDCGLKTRDWPETKQALQNMAAAAKALRLRYNKK